MNATLTGLGGRQFVVIDCFKCAVEFAMPLTLNETCLRDKQDFYCPNGHGQQYTTSYKEIIARLRTDLGEAIAARDKAESVRQQLLARVEHGVCPHCQRSFQNLRRHMDTKHKAARRAMERA